jgi:hypothetical protein
MEKFEPAQSGRSLMDGFSTIEKPTISIFACYSVFRDRCRSGDQLGAQILLTARSLSRPRRPQPFVPHRGGSNYQNHFWMRSLEVNFLANI